MPRYLDVLAHLREAFPTPTSDPTHDGYMVVSLLRALDRVDALKSNAPILGTPRSLDFPAAMQSAVERHGHSLESVAAELVKTLDGMLIWNHPQSQVNVVPCPSIASIIGVLLPSMYNPNLCSEESGFGFSEAEVRVASMAVSLVGYEAAKSGGVFTFGGTGTLLYGAKIGLEKALPSSMQTGLRERPVIVCSERSHYACLTVAGWLGIGFDNVVKVPAKSDNAIDLDAFETMLDGLLAEGRPIAAIVATLGTTDAFGLDDLAAMHAIRERLATKHQLKSLPHLHADAVIGWAWSVFNDYDFAHNPLGFRGRTLRALAAIVNVVQHLPLADSIGIDFHKTGFAPYVSTLFLLRDRHDFATITRQRESMPYLYHSGDYHPGMYTLETSRSATGVMSALGSLLLLGREGLQALLGHAIEMEDELREKIVARPELTVVNEQNFGPVTLFRAYPRHVNTFDVLRRERDDSSYRTTLLRHNEFNRRIHQEVQREALAGRGVALGFTESYTQSRDGEPINALKSYVLSPFVERIQVSDAVKHVLAAREKVESEMSATA